MTNRDNFLAMMTGGRPWRLPYFFHPTAPVRGMIRERTGVGEDAAFGADFAGVGVDFIDDDPDLWKAAYERIGFIVPDDASIGRKGVVQRRPKGKVSALTTHLSEMLHPLATIETVEQLEELPWPDITNPANFTHLADHCQSIQSEGMVAAGNLECTLFESTWYLRGMENVFCDLLDENPVTDWLLDYFTRRSTACARAFAEAGFDVIRLGDDIGTQKGMLMSLEMWREHFKPRLRQVVAAIRAASGERKVWVQYHSDGDITDAIDDLIEIGIDILNPIQPECMDPEVVAAKSRDRIALCGMIGTQTTLPFGSTADVQRAVERCRQLYAEGARVIVGPTHVVQPDVPWENIVAFIAAAKRGLIC